MQSSRSVLVRRSGVSVPSRVTEGGFRRRTGWRSTGFKTANEHGAIRGLGGDWTLSVPNGTEGPLVLVESRFRSSDTYTVTVGNGEIEGGRGQAIDVGRRTQESLRRAWRRASQ